MNAISILDILSRWIHIVAACLTIGGAFFIRVVVPIGICQLDEPARHAVFLKIRRTFKFVVHPAILFLLLSGTYNVIRGLPWYTQNPPVMHGMFGLHMLLGLAVITISLVLLAGAEPIQSHRTAMKINLVLMALLILSASALKWTREHTPPPAGTQTLSVVSK